LTGIRQKKIAEKINEVLNSPDLILEIKEHQKKAKEILCWEKECKKLETYFK
jgi:DNA-binding transcriptional regulator GbsR (MarR family)